MADCEFYDEFKEVQRTFKNRRKKRETSKRDKNTGAYLARGDSKSIVYSDDGDIDDLDLDNSLVYTAVTKKARSAIGT